MPRFLHLQVVIDEPTSQVPLEKQGTTRHAIGCGCSVSFFCVCLGAGYPQGAIRAAGVPDVTPMLDRTLRKKPDFLTFSLGT